MHRSVFVQGNDAEQLMYDLEWDGDDESPFLYDDWKFGGRYKDMLGPFPFALVKDIDIARVECPWVYLTSDGVWHEEDINLDEISPEWDNQVRRWLRSLPGDEVITVVDIHY